MSAPDLQFSIRAAEVLKFGASPHIVFKLSITNSAGSSIHSIILKSQIHLEAARRHYSASEQARLMDLFGEPARWGETLRSMLWTNLSTVVPSFDEATVVDVHVPCTFDFNVAATKYFNAIAEGEIPICFYFSGTIFYMDADMSVKASHISWEKEAGYNLPIRIWREMMDAYYPNTAWLCLGRDVFDRLHAYKVQHGIPTFDQTLTKVMQMVEGSPQ